MKKSPKTRLEPDKSKKEILPILLKYNLKKMADLNKTVKDWTAKILKLSVRINDQYPELSECLEQMPVTISDVKNPLQTVIDLKKYYDSLSKILNEYLIKNPKHSGYEK